MSTPAPPRLRPRDRKQRIEDAATLAFAQSGYHGVAMNDVARAVGISAPALYRHFPNKYALFVRAAFRTAHRLLEDTESIAETVPRDADGARRQLDDLLDAVIGTTVELRAVGGIYRWEGRYLETEDRARLTAEFETLRARFVPAVALARPELDADSRDTLVWAALAVVASITAHRTVLAAGTLRDTVHGAARRVLAASVVAAAPARVLLGDDPSRRRDRLVAAAIERFAARGYHDVSIEDIATAADLTPSGVYRHFASKSEILLAACERAAERLEQGAARAEAEVGDPVAVLRRLSADYVRFGVENHALMRVYFADAGNLSAEEQRRLRAPQRAYLARWTDELRRARPELGPREAAVLVHAAFGVVADLGVRAHRRGVDLSGQIELLVPAVLGVA